MKNLSAMCFGREPIRPLMFSYYITHRCNLGCRYCCDGEGKRFKEDPIPELSTADACRLISILRRAGDTLDITGGEPLVRDDLEEIFSHAKQIGFRTVLNTKGIGGSGLRGRWELLRHISVLVLSLDTFDTSTLSNVIGRPRAAAEEIIATVHDAPARCRETGTRLVLASVATPANLADVAKVLAFAMENGLGFQLSPEIAGTAVNPALRNNPAYRDLINHTLAAKRDQRGVLGVDRYLTGIRDFSTFRCHPLLMPVIRPDGRMYYPCLEWKRAEINLLESGDYFEALRTARKRFGEIPACRDCCHIFCHMALSLLQSQPLAAIRELRHWNP